MTSGFVPWCHVTGWADTVDCRDIPGNYSYTEMCSNNLSRRKNNGKPHNTTKLKLKLSPAQLPLCRTPGGFGWQNNGPTQTSTASPQSLWTGHLHSKRGFVMSLSLGSWAGKTVLDYPGWPHVTTRVLTRTRRRRQEMRQWNQSRVVPWLEGATRQGTQGASGSWQRTGTVSSGASGRNAALLTPWF